ncbi:hypothetical protein [Aurantimonas aggregata]|nr:hypothetical protein [Aurantimonas aggregata]
MGFIPDGTYKVFNGLMLLPPSVRQQVMEIAVSASNERITAGEALSQIAEFLPPEAAALIKQYSSNPVVILAIILWILTSLGTFAGGIGSLYKAFVPSDPTPQTIINNYGTIINESAAGDGAEEGVAKPLKREQVRRLRQMERQKQKLEREGDEQAKDEGQIDA